MRGVLHPINPRPGSASRQERRWGMLASRTGARVQAHNIWWAGGLVVIAQGRQGLPRATSDAQTAGTPPTNATHPMPSNTSVTSLLL
jgi:hypothetical protein